MTSDGDRGFSKCELRVTIRLRKILMIKFVYENDDEHCGINISTSIYCT